MALKGQNISSVVKHLSLKEARMNSLCEFTVDAVVSVVAGK